MKISSAVFGTLTVAIAVAAIWIANQHGMWYGALIVCALIGLFTRGTLRAFALAWLSALGGWGLELLWESLREPIAGAASAVAGMAGLSAAQGGTLIAAALILAFLFATVGAWVGVALRSLAPFGQADH